MGSILVAGGQVLHPRLIVNYIKNLSKTDRHSTIMLNHHYQMYNKTRILMDNYKVCIQNFPLVTPVPLFDYLESDDKLLSCNCL